MDVWIEAEKGTPDGKTSNEDEHSIVKLVEKYGNIQTKAWHHIATLKFNCFYT